MEAKIQKPYVLNEEQIFDQSTHASPPSLGKVAAILFYLQQIHHRPTC